MGSRVEVEVRERNATFVRLQREMWSSSQPKAAIARFSWVLGCHRIYPCGVIQLRLLLSDTCVNCRTKRWSRNCNLAPAPVKWPRKREECLTSYELTMLVVILCKSLEFFCKASYFVRSLALPHPDISQKGQGNFFRGNMIRYVIVNKCSTHCQHARASSGRTWHCLLIVPMSTAAPLSLILHEDGVWSAPGSDRFKIVGLSGGEMTLGGRNENGRICILHSLMGLKDIPVNNMDILTNIVVMAMSTSWMFESSVKTPR